MVENLGSVIITYYRVSQKNVNRIREASLQEKCIFLTLFKKPLTPPFRLNTYVVNFSEGILTKVRKRLSQQLSTK